MTLGTILFDVAEVMVEKDCKAVVAGALQRPIQSTGWVTHQRLVRDR